jgi:catechol 2,3-dioxygenase-like lactoylglutathione lyase family enzyme
MTRLVSLVLVVRNLERALTVYEAGLGFERVEAPSDVPSLGARHIFLRADNCMLELLEPHDETMPPGLFLRARGEGVFSIAVGVDDPVAARDRLRQAFVEVRGVPGEQKRVFVRPNDAHGVLVEVNPLGAPPASG